MFLKLQSKIVNMVSGHEKKIRFLIAGGLNTLVGLSIYPLLYLALTPFGVGYFKVLFLSQIPSVTFSFITNKYFVFKSKGNVKQEYLKFFSFYGFYFLLNLIALPILVELLRIEPIISQALFSVAIILTSYFWHNMVTFKQTSEGIK